MAGAAAGRLRGDLLGAGPPGRRRPRGLRIVAAHARLLPASRPGRGLHRVRRGGDGPRAGGPADLVPAHDLRRLLAPRAAREHARGPRGLTAVAGRDAHADAPAPRARRAAPDVGALGAVVRRGGGVAQLAAGPRLLPEPAAEPVLGQRGRRDHGRGRPRAVGGGHPDGRAGGPRHPVRVPGAPPDLRLLPDPLRRRAEAHRCHEHRPCALRRRVRRPRGGRRADGGRPRPGMARLQRLARELRRPAARAGAPHDGADAVVGPADALGVRDRRADGGRDGRSGDRQESARLGRRHRKLRTRRPG